MAKRNSKCTKCQLHEKAYTKCVWGEGPSNAVMMFITAVPHSFHGHAGDILDHILEKLSLSRNDVYLASALKCRPPKNKKLPGKKDKMVCWEACQKYLNQEIKEINPKVIVLMGNEPLAFLAGLNFISKHEGSRLCKDKDVSTFASLHPAACLGNPKHEASVATAIFVAAKAAGLKPKAKAGGEFYDYEIRS